VEMARVHGLEQAHQLVQPRPAGAQGWATAQVLKGNAARPAGAGPSGGGGFLGIQADGSNARALPPGVGWQLAALRPR